MARGDFPSTKLDQYMLRFPDGMRERLKEHAAENGRSLNAEIIHRLENSERGMGATTTALDDVAEKFMRRFADAPFRPGQVDKFNELYLKAKKKEVEAIRDLFDGAQRLLDRAHDGEAQSD